MTASINIDSSDIARLEKIFAAMPHEIRHRVAGRAMKRMAQRAKTIIVKDVASLVQIAQKHVHSRTKTFYDTGDMSLDTNVTSAFIPLIEIGGRRMRAELNETERRARRRLARAGKELKGSYRQAFLATVKRDQAVFRREGAARGPLDEMHGPNPAHAIANAPERYEALMMEILRTYLVDRVLHEMQQALRK